MGFFGVVKTLMRKSQSALVIEKLLDRFLSMGMLPSGMPPAVIANKLVEAAWEGRPEVFAFIPHRLAVAACALSGAVLAVERRGSSGEAKAAFVLSLGAVLIEIAGTSERLKLTTIDLLLIEEAELVFQRASTGDGSERESVEGEAQVVSAVKPMVRPSAKVPFEIGDVRPGRE